MSSLAIIRLMDPLGGGGRRERKRGNTGHQGIHHFHRMFLWLPGPGEAVAPPIARTP
jgi:hypothetical protein